MPTPPTFWRPPRLKRLLPNNEIVIPEPPPEPSSSTGSLLTIILPVALMALVMLGLALFTAMNSMLYFSIPLILASSIASVVLYQMQKRTTQQQKLERQQKYRALLADIDAQLQNLSRQQYTLRNSNDPTLHECLQRVANLDRNLWARSPDDDDFLSVRVGIGRQPSTVKIKTPEVRNVIHPDPLVVEAQQMASNYAWVLGVPVTLNLRETQITGIGGDRFDATACAFAIIAQLATHHAPDEVKIAAVFPEDEHERWAWVRWLPHTWQNDRRVRFLANDAESAHRLMVRLEHLLDDRLRVSDEYRSGKKVTFTSHFVIFITSHSMLETDPVVQRLQREGPGVGFYVVFLGSRTKSLPQSCRAVIRLSGTQSHLIWPAGDSASQEVAPDYATDEFCAAFAQTIAPIRLQQVTARSIPTSVTLLEQLKVQSVEELRIAERWNISQTAGKSLAVAIGMAAGNEPILLDLHERADGPNGLVAGMVGAGKSELLQTLVASLAINFHPHRLAFVLVDYKGGGMADPFTDLPHTLGVITNLQQENLAARALTSFNVELDRRQKLFKLAGVIHIDDYHKLYYAGQVREPLPYLVVIVDEFAEMKSEQPETAKGFVRIARLGRALGLRLILAMQKPAGIVDGQIEANTRFRLCLRVAQTEDSQAMLKRPDAAYLVGIGRAYLQVGANEVFKEFQVGWSGAAYVPDNIEGGDPREVVAVELDGHRRTLYASAEKTTHKETTQLKAVVDHLILTARAQQVSPLPQLWLDALPPLLILDETRPDEGWDGQQWRPVAEWIMPIVGRIDEPLEKRQRPLQLNLGKEGHLAIYSAPGYGKTTFVQTLITSLALTYSPDDVNIYVLDFGGRLLKLFEPLPHVGGVITADERERMERLLLMLRRKMDERRVLLGEAGVASLLDYRRISGKLIPAIVVVIDNYANFSDMSQDDETIANTISKLAQDGGNLGVHLVLTANNSTTIRFAISSNIMLAVALHMVETGEYGAIVGRTEELKPTTLPGRGLVRGNPPLECQIALPCQGNTDAERSVTLRGLVRQIAASWSGSCAPAISVLPEKVALASIPGMFAGSSLLTAAPIGLHVDDLTPFVVDLQDGPNFLISGPAQSGKSTILRTWIIALTKQMSPAQLQVYILDSQRRSLAALQAIAHVQGYSDTANNADDLLRELEHILQSRRDDSIRSSAIDTYPLLVVVVDDLWDPYESGLSDSAKEAIARIMRLARGLPFHLLATGRTSELASKAWAEPVKTLKEMQVGIILGSGDDSFFNTRLPYQERGRLLPIGEGYYVNRSYVRRVKLAVPDSQPADASVFS
jgi:S-DNA-T family DNA segregation ATPase FtsK/SpoIIIE